MSRQKEELRFEGDEERSKEVGLVPLNARPGAKSWIRRAELHLADDRGNQADNPDTDILISPMAPSRALSLNLATRPLARSSLFTPTLTIVRNARMQAAPSNAAKSRTLAKPDKWRPPSHPTRLPKQPRTYGVPLTAEQKQAMSRKRYPNMFPPEGTLAHTVITSRALHVAISMV
jgi:hypothetical protein